MQPPSPLAHVYNTNRAASTLQALATEPEPLKTQSINAVLEQIAKLTAAFEEVRKIVQLLVARVYGSKRWPDLLAYLHSLEKAAGENFWFDQDHVEHSELHRFVFGLLASGSKAKADAYQEAHLKLRAELWNSGFYIRHQRTEGGAK